MTSSPEARQVWPQLHDAQRRVLREVIIHGSQPRVELARIVGLSRTSLTRIARELVDLGLLVEGESQRTPGRGRPRELLHLRPQAAHFLGVKLTGDHLYAVVTDLSATVVDERTEVLASTAVADVADRIGQLCAELLADTPAAVGVCLAGTVTERDGTQYVDHSIFLGWDAAPLRSLLAERTALPVTVTNDVVALTGAHHWFGAGVGAESLVVFGVGAGIGSGIVTADEVVRGAFGRAGRVGHARLDGNGMPCELGHTDCVHSFVSIPAIEHNAGRGYVEALTAARAGEADAAGAFSLAARALGIAIAVAVNSVDPEKVLVTGEGVDMAHLDPAALRAGMSEYLEQVDADSVAIEYPEFRFAHYARGAAIAAIRDLV